MNAQAVRLYVAMRRGLFLYESKPHTLRLVVASDVRRVTGNQDFVDTSLDLVFVADQSRMKLVSAAQREVYAHATGRWARSSERKPVESVARLERERVPAHRPRLSARTGWGLLNQRFLIMIQELLFSRPSRGACAVTLILAAALSPIFAEAAGAPAPAGSPEANYQIERADCLAGRTQQGQKTCLYEAASARDAARKGLLTTETPQVVHDNLQQRCLVQPEGPERVACDRMAQGEGTVTGSVAAGGELRELTTVVPPQKKPRRAKPVERAASSAQ